mmetsp:Transcript_121846/g.350243  ORF Transcript_121846/g.350243 Transcript_121846/m.350243 type:complete len:204 (+) Transcript_121846:2012-2623(+)
MASSFCPPPMAIWWKFMPGLDSCAYLVANSSNSCEGSAPGVVMKRIGSFECVSSLWSFGKLRGGGDKELTPKASQANCVRADSRRSGRTACTSSTRWKELMRENTEGSNDSSHLSDAAQAAHTASLVNIQWSSIFGKAARRICTDCARSCGHHDGGGALGMCGGMYVPWKSSHSFGSNFSGMMPRTRCRPNVRRSALKRDRDK